MTETELLARLVRGDNLSKLFAIAQNQKSISAPRLYALLDEVWSEQKRMVTSYQAWKTSQNLEFNEHGVLVRKATAKMHADLVERDIARDRNEKN